MKTKIKTKQEIAEIVEQAKAQGKIVVTTNGSFDLFHSGHLDLLENAKAQGDLLIVGLNSDKSVKSYKGEKRPIIPEEQRAKILAALNCVDYVILFDEPTCLNFVENIKPNIHTNDIAYGENCIEAQVVEKYGGKIFLIPRKINISTSDIINKIKKLQ